MTAVSDQQQLSEAELEYARQVRQAPVADLLLQAVQVLGTGAEVKLGRRDARSLIDAMAAVVDVAGPALGDYAARLSQAVGQLKLAQVQAEQELAAAGIDEEGAGAQEPGGASADGGQEPAGGGAATTSSPGGKPGGAQRLTDRLWVPGRDPGPAPRR